MLPIETKKALDFKTVESMRFPNSYILMTHLEDQNIVTETLHYVGLSTDDIETPNATISGSQVKKLLELNIERHSSPIPYSIIIAEEFNVATHGIFGLSIASSKNLKEAAKATKKYSKIINPAVKYTFQVKMSITSCILDVEPAFETAGIALVEINMMVIRQFLELAKNKISPEYVQFQHDTPFPLHYFEEYFGCPVYFGQKDNRIVIKTQYIKSPMMFYNHSTSHALDNQLEKSLERVNKTQAQWTNKVTEQLTLNIKNSASLSRDKIAEYFNITPRTLNRKLQQEGSCYQTLTETVKCNMAIDELTNTDKHISQISDELGFKEPQSFARAFKRWTGKTASHYRNGG